MFASINDALQVFLISLIPYLELRVGIPYGISQGLHPVWATTLGIAGGLTELILSFVALFGLIALSPRVPALQAVFDWFERRAARRSGRWLRYGTLGLILAVGLPVPGTGTWTGIAVAQLMGLTLRQTFVFVSLGVALSGVTVGLVSTGLFNFLRPLLR